MRICSLDIDSSNIGIAISSICQTLLAYSFSIKTKLFSWPHLQMKYNIDHLIIGLSKHKDGNLTKNGIFVKNFVEENIKTNYEFICEWYTTKMAEKVIRDFKLKKTKDEISSQIMLFRYCKMENYLNHWNIFI